MRGTPVRCPNPIRRPRDHPRVCGEHGMADIGDAFNSGSSPRMRGTHMFGIGGQGGKGIIPAYAGNTLFYSTIVVSMGDHPRVCGEHICSGSYVITVPGSSPRMRGTLQRRPQCHFTAGIIPAYAGNTGGNVIPFTDVTDHPRVCGEHYPESAICGHNRGSSPRMRGTRVGLRARRPT